jgi:hypothetical protein
LYDFILIGFNTSQGRFVERIKRRITWFWRTSSYDSIFIAVMFVLIALFTIMFVYDPSGAQANIFFEKTQDFFADYFNVAKMSVDRNPYWFGQIDPTPWEHGYPPLCYLIFYVLARFADYSNLSSFEAGFTTLGLTTAFMCMFAVALFFFALLRHAYHRQGAQAFLLPLTLFASSIFIFSFERGNIIMLAAACLTCFIIGYRSENKVVSELALIALAVSTALKGYPAVLGLLLLFDKRYSEAARAAIYALILIFVPFLFFEGGFGNISIWLHNISLNSQVYGDAAPVFGLGVFAHIGSFFGDQSLAQSSLTALNTINKIVCVVALVASIFQTTRWKQVMLLLCVLVCVQANSARYLGLYLFIGVILFFNVKEHAKFDWFYLVLFVIILNPLQIVSSSGSNFTVGFMGMATDAVLVMLTVESLVMGAKHFKTRRGLIGAEH